MLTQTLQAKHISNESKAIFKLYSKSITAKHNTKRCENFFLQISCRFFSPIDWQKVLRDGNPTGQTLISARGTSFGAGGTRCRTLFRSRALPVPHSMNRRMVKDRRVYHVTHQLLQHVLVAHDVILCTVAVCNVGQNAQSLQWEQ